jgi:hypothetical protein
MGVMELGTAPLFDLTAAAVTQVVEAAAPITRTRSEELLAGIRDDQQVITDREIAKVTLARAAIPLQGWPGRLEPTSQPS